MNQLEFRSKKQTVFSIALLHSKGFRKSRSETEEGRRLYNKELKMAEDKIKEYKIDLKEPLPEDMN